MTASDHAQQRSQRFPLRERGRPQMDSGPSRRRDRTAQAVNRCADDKTEGSPEARLGDRTGCCVTGEHLAALALREGGQRIQIAFCGGARLLESP